ncbi:hypothetical protein diail_7718 [Diaporthe ilicicola]|nr:hypothetical protein diail_7718 [Diaporthe ilicicola]
MATTDPAPPAERLQVPKEVLCAVCRKDDVRLSACGICFGVWYCSSACQRTDWQIHKMLCKAYSESGRPQDGKLYSRVFFFHPDKHLPEIQWLDLAEENFRHSLMGTGSEPPGADSQVGTDVTLPIQPPGVTYGYQLEIARRDQAEFVTPNVNQSLAAAIASAGGTNMTTWKGPVVVSRGGLNQHQRAMDLEEFIPGMGVLPEDVTMADFRCCVQWMANRQSGEVADHGTLYIPYDHLDLSVSASDGA